jgi:hypothetical protein
LEQHFRPLFTLKGFSNGVQFVAIGKCFSTRKFFTYEYGELLTINPSYSLTYNETNYSNYVVKAATQCRTNSIYKPLIIGLKNWVFGNDIHSIRISQMALKGFLFME